MDVVSYSDFLAAKTHEGANFGFIASRIPNQAFDFQEALIEWAVQKGRAAIFADCGLGKTLMELSWADNVCRNTGGNVLILTCIAVAAQMVEEAEKFGVPCTLGEATAKVKVDDKDQSFVRTATIKRWTFVIDKSGKIAAKNSEVKAAEDSQAILELVEKLK